MREAFFEQTLQAMQRRPSDYPDAMPRKKRVLEKLAIAPPLPPREPTAAELQQQEQNDARLREYLKFRLGPIIIELKKRYKRFCKAIGVSLTPAAAREHAMKANHVSAGWCRNRRAAAGCGRKQPRGCRPCAG